MQGRHTAESESAAVPSKEAAQLAKGAKGPAVAVWRRWHVRLQFKMEMSMVTTYGESGTARGGTVVVLKVGRRVKSRL